MIALAIAYLAVALFACIGTFYCAVTVYPALRFLLRPAEIRAREGAAPFISILKPIRGLEPELFENLCSFCDQEYAAFEVIFGVQDVNDPALGVIDAVIARFPERRLTRVVEPGRLAGNPKVANLANMLPRASGEIVIVADADMRVERDYLATVAADFDDPRVGAATCLYAGEPRGGIASELAVLQINDQFAPSVLVATTFSDPAFCFGSTMAVRRSVLAEIGGFEALASTIADDYMLGALVSSAGHRVKLSRYVVTNVVHEENVNVLIEHELRWARTIRSVRPAGYISTIVTYPLPFALIGILLQPFNSGAWIALGVVLAMRLTIHVMMTALFRLKKQERLAWLLPLRDCLGLYVWARGLFGNTVTWKSQQLATRY
jgi:ceramide glucosyltransferase